MRLSIGFVTARDEPQFEWFLDSLMPQLQIGDDIEVINCDLNFDKTLRSAIQKTEGPVVRVVSLICAEPKPCVFAGKHRLTKDNWWCKPSQINTVVCHATKDMIAFVDDRCVLSEHWLQSIRNAQAGGYAVAGSYEKRHNMKVKDGVITDMGVPDGTDFRSPYGKDHRRAIAEGKAIDCEGAWFFGATYALPLEWMLRINGSDERLNATSFEDCIMGCQLINAGYKIKFDPRMYVIQDRTPSECGPPIRRTSKENHPNDTSDKCHTALRVFAKENRANHHINLRELRDRIQAGGEWPGIETCPQFDWFDNMPIKDFDNIP